MIYHHMRVQADQRRQELASESERDHQAERVLEERSTWIERIAEPFGGWLVRIGERIESHYTVQHQRRLPEQQSTQAELRRETL